MRSIRRHLLSRLLAGLTVVWAGAGLAVLWTVRSGLEGRADAELRSLVFPVRSLIARSFAGRFPPPMPGPLLRSPEIATFDHPNGTLFFEAWDVEGKVVAKSKSLRERDLKVSGAFTMDPRFVDLVLPTGEAARALVFRFNEPPGPGGPGPRWRMMWGARGDDARPPGLHVAIARSRKEMDHALALTLAGIVAGGLVAGIVSALLVRYAVRSGLTPLQDMAARASGIDASTLQARFSAEGLPAELHPIADRLNDLIARLELGFERERRFGSDLAHELRTPIAELKSMAEVAVKWPEGGSEQSYQDVLAIAEQMQATVENLLLLGRLDKGAKELLCERVDLASFVQECVQPFREQASARRLTWEIQLEEEAFVECDPRLLRIVLRNLFSNAAEYAPEGTRVEVVGLRPKSEGAGALDLTIRNAAPDLTPADVPHLFERLWRLDKSRASSRHSGLGLSIALACAKAMSLRLTAELDADRILAFSLRG
ncbi:MAG: hypothetical protein HYR88_15495 [Verrucomicrobia bacterium]|nr:hypothetical protein [Verrucomicrobiota bacterium]MBI3870384.1 hypothetical protein [Verrucomicrobiota bacterium]